MADDSKHLNIYLHKILEYIKKQDRAVGYKELEDQTGVSILKNPYLIKSLRANEKILLENNSIKFVPAYVIRTKDDLLDILKAVNAQEGIEISKLKDSPFPIQEFIDQLIEENKIIMLKDLDGSEIVFYNESPFPSVSSEIKALWASIKVPNYHDITNELNEAGLKGSDNPTIIKNRIIKKTASKKNKRRITITNTHVKGLDLQNLDDSDS